MIITIINGCKISHIQSWENDVILAASMTSSSCEDRTVEPLSLGSMTSCWDTEFHSGLEYANEHEGYSQQVDEHTCVGSGTPVLHGSCTTSIYLHPGLGSVGDALRRWNVLLSVVWYTDFRGQEGLVVTVQVITHLIYTGLHMIATQAVALAPCTVCVYVLSPNGTSHTWGDVKTGRCLHLGQETTVTESETQPQCTVSLWRHLCHCYLSKNPTPNQGVFKMSYRP